MILYYFKIFRDNEIRLRAFTELFVEVLGIRWKVLSSIKYVIIIIIIIIITIYNLL